MLRFHFFTAKHGTWEHKDDRGPSILGILLVHLSRRLKCTIVITCCPPSVVRRPSVVVNFSHFRDLLLYRGMEFNETEQEARSQRPLPSLRFSGRSEKRWPPRPLISWDIFDFSSETAEWNSLKLDMKQDLNVLNVLSLCLHKQTWQEASSQRHLQNLCF